MSRYCLSHGKVGEKSCAIENIPWSHLCNSSDLRNNGQVYRVISKDSLTPALRAAPVAHVLCFMWRSSVVAYSCPLPLKMHLVLLWTVSKRTTSVPAQHVDSTGSTIWGTGRFWLFLVQSLKKRSLETVTPAVMESISTTQLSPSSKASVRLGGHLGGLSKAQESHEHMSEWTSIGFTLDS